ncbi:MAG: cytochrome c oxidase subunit 3 [Verrucomicrobiota bacterium]|nr:cytochrome c oxidase subunit 3 [Verrucomicrobiota bacterium]
MTPATLSVDEIEFELKAEKTRARFGMILFLASEAMLFAGLIGAYIVLRWTAPVWPAVGEYSYMFHMPPTMINIIMAINTMILIGSSFTFHFAEVAIKSGKSPAKWLFVTILMGSVFLCGQAYEWNYLIHHKHVVFQDGVYGATFFALTGFHGVHVIVGVLLLIWTFIGVSRGKFTQERHLFFDNAGLYWHFVDIVWVGLFSLLYFDLVGHILMPIGKVLWGLF